MAPDRFPFSLVRQIHEQQLVKPIASEAFTVKVFGTSSLGEQHQVEPQKTG
jgi:hypothetical protein